SAPRPVISPVPRSRWTAAKATFDARARSPLLDAVARRTCCHAGNPTSVVVNPGLLPGTIPAGRVGFRYEHSGCLGAGAAARCRIAAGAGTVRCESAGVGGAARLVGEQSVADGGGQAWHPDRRCRDLPGPVWHPAG